MDDRIKVFCRLRPINKFELSYGEQTSLDYNETNISIMTDGDSNKHHYTFDHIFGPEASQKKVFDIVGKPIIKGVMDGYNGTVFAYGQTCSGKTFTMEGNSIDSELEKGLIPRMIDEIFELINYSSKNLEFFVKVSFLEIYNEKIFDLLDTKKNSLQIKEEKLGGIYVKDITEVNIDSADDMLKIMRVGSENRKIALTNMNSRSSRSHSIFITDIKEKNIENNQCKHSKLYFIDLAGSEKISKTQVTGQQLEETKNINKSLSCLGNVIHSLTLGKHSKHIPYRDSKLTRLLQESLGGNSNTSLIITCSMSSYNDKETLSTLRFGNRAKSIKNKPLVNFEIDVNELKTLLKLAEKKIRQQDDIINNMLSSDIPVSSSTLNASLDDDNKSSNFSSQECLEKPALKIFNQHLQIIDLKENSDKIYKKTLLLEKDLDCKKSENDALKKNIYSLERKYNSLLTLCSKNIQESKLAEHQHTLNLIDFSFLDSPEKELAQSNQNSNRKKIYWEAGDFSSSDISLNETKIDEIITDPHLDDLKILYKIISASGARKDQDQTFDIDGNHDFCISENDELVESIIDNQVGNQEKSKEIISKQKNMIEILHNNNEKLKKSLLKSRDELDLMISQYSKVKIQLGKYLEDQIDNYQNRIKNLKKILNQKDLETSAHNRLLKKSLKFKENVIKRLRYEISRYNPYHNIESNSQNLRKLCYGLIKKELSTKKSDGSLNKSLSSLENSHESTEYGIVKNLPIPRTKESDNYLSR